MKGRIHTQTPTGLVQLYLIEQSAAEKKKIFLGRPDLLQLTEELQALGADVVTTEDRLRSVLSKSFTRLCRLPESYKKFRQLENQKYYLDQPERNV